MVKKALVRETSKHINAYHYWFNLTEKGYDSTKALELTAKEFDVTDRAVRYWHYSFQWEERAKIRRKEIMKEVEKQENRTLAENRVSYLKILHKLLDDYIQEGLPAQIESIKDLDLVIKNCLLLQDSPTERVKNDNININVDAEDLFDEDLMRQIIEEERQERQKQQENEEEDENVTIESIQ